VTRLTHPFILISNFVDVAQNAKQISDAQNTSTGAPGQLGSLAPGGGGSSNDQKELPEI